MATIHDLEARRPHLRGPARCLVCQHAWEAVTPVGCIAGLECPQCQTRKGVYQGLVIPRTRFVCNCGNDLYYILPDGYECANCGIEARGV